MGRKIIIFTMIVTAAAFLPMLLSSKQDDMKLVTINKFVDHPALNASSDGVMDALRKRIPSIMIDEQDAQGSSTNAFQIAKHQASSNPEAMVAIATPSAQSTLKARRDNNIIIGFAAVTDAKAANLENGVNVIGVTDSPPVEKLITLTSKLFPNRKRVGTIYNPGEINSVNTIERLKKFCDELNLELIEAPVNSSSNVKMATQKLVDSVDIIYIPQDNMVVSSIEAVVQVTNSSNVPIVDNIPIVSNDDSYLSKGILIALGTNYYKSGLQLGNLIADQMESGETKSNIQISDGEELQLNDKMLEKFGITRAQVEELLQ